MKIENKLTLAHLRMNKKRTALTIFGIIISVALIISVFIGIASLLDYNERMAISDSGNAHFFINDINDEKIKILKNDDRIESVGLIETGRSETSGVRVEGAKSLRHSTAYIHWYNSDKFSQLNIESMDGRFPKNKGEILLNRSYIENNGFDWKVGDTITLQTGRRHRPNKGAIEFNVDEIFRITLTSRYEYGEVFDFYENRTFKIAGIVNDKTLDYEINQMYSICNDNSTYRAEVQLKRVTPFSMMTIDDIASELGINPNNKAEGDFFLNDTLLATHLCGPADSYLITKYIPMGAAILLIILIAAFMLIYNTFGMSIAERTKYLGMLSSVGATKKQKRNSSYFEGLILGLIGIPVGTILGVLVMLIGIKAINNAGFTSIPLKFSLPVWLLAIAVAISVLTIFLSLYVPAKKASQATAIEAIRQNNMIRIKKTKNPFIIKKLFGFEGILAYKNLKRNNKKSRLITISIAISAILFLCVNYYSSITAALVANELNSPYQVEFAIPGYADKEKIIKDIEGFPGVNKVYSIEHSIYSYGKSDSELFYDRTITEQNNTTNKYKKLWEDVQLTLNFIEDDDFDALCKKNGIDPKPYYELKDRRQKCVIMNNIDHKENGDKIFNETIIGGFLASNAYQWFENEEIRKDMEIDKLSKEEQEQLLQDIINEQTYVDIAGIVEYDKDNYVCNLNSEKSISAYAPFSMNPIKITKILYEEEEGDTDYNYSYGVETDNHEQICEEIYRYYDEHPEYAKDNSAWAFDIYGYALKTIQQNQVIKIFIYGFIILITLITFVNIINTITTSIASRRREFAIIKSVGITQKDFEKTIAYESIFYAINSLLIAIPISIGINLFLNHMVADGKIPYTFDFFTYLIIIAAVFLFVGTTMIYSIKKIKNDNIIENIKKDLF